MTRIKTLDRAAYPWYIRLIFWGQERKYGKVLGPAYLWGRVPALMLGLQIYYRFLDRKSSLLDKSLRALVSLRISQLNHCAFCFDLSSSFIAKLGIPDAKLAALADFRTSEDYGGREKAALAYAEDVTKTGSAVEERVFTELKRHFSEEEIVELTGWIAFQNLSSKFNAALDVPAQGFCLRPK
ncbi:MAG: carboxymuconolactone decarboxylase family protein [Elusimicrobiota bacterium]